MILSTFALSLALSAAQTATTTTSVALTSPAPVAGAEQPAEKPKTEKRYCMKPTLTGTRMVRKICDTREGWLNRGVDPLEK